MRVRDRETPEFRRLRKRIEGWILARFERANPEYVEFLREELSKPDVDVERTIADALPLLKERSPYQGVLTCLLDVELWADKCRQAAWYLGYADPEQFSAFGNQGLWLTYHIDAWFLFAYGLLDRWHRLVTSVCRDVMRDAGNARFKVIEGNLAEGIEKMKAILEAARNRIAHGGGSVEALSDDGLWEPYLVASDMSEPDGVIHILDQEIEIPTTRRGMWHAGVDGFTGTLVDQSDAWLRTLVDEAFSSD